MLLRNDSIWVRRNGNRLLLSNYTQRIWIVYYPLSLNYAKSLVISYLNAFNVKFWILRDPITFCVNDNNFIAFAFSKYFWWFLYERSKNSIEQQSWESLWKSGKWEFSTASITTKSCLLNEHWYMKVRRRMTAGACSFTTDDTQLKDNHLFPRVKTSSAFRIIPKFNPIHTIIYVRQYSWSPFCSFYHMCQ